MKKYGIFCLIVASTLSASAATVWLENGGKEKITTGDALDKIKAMAVTVPVVEIPGLSITAKTTVATQEINSLSESFGVIDKTNPADDRSCFDGGEAVLLNFDKTVRIIGIDFNRFDKGESFTIQIGEKPHVITYELLSNKSTDLYECDLAVPAGTEIRLSVTEAPSQMGLDALELEVIEPTGSVFDQNLPSKKSINPLLKWK